MAETEGGVRASYLFPGRQKLSHLSIFRSTPTPYHFVRNILTPCIVWRNKCHRALWSEGADCSCPGLCQNPPESGMRPPPLHFEDVGNPNRPSRSKWRGLSFRCLPVHLCSGDGIACAGEWCDDTSTIPFAACRRPVPKQVVTSPGYY